MKAEQARKLADDQVDRLAKALEAGHSETMKTYLAVMARFPRYSFRNQLLIASQRPDATRVAGFRTWQKLKRWVKRGEQGIVIVAPMPLRRKDPPDPDRDNAFIAFKAAHVFDVSQTDGEALPELGTVHGDPAGYIDLLKEEIAWRGISLRYAEDLQGADGASAGGTIILRESLSPAEQFSVLVHELAHEILHQGERKGQVPRRVRELEAEAVAFVVSEAIGLDTNTASADYIQLYRGDVETLTESLDAIQKTAAAILEALMPEEPRVAAAA